MALHHHLGLDVHDVGTMQFLQIQAVMVFWPWSRDLHPAEGFEVRWWETDIVIQKMRYLDLMGTTPS